MVELSVLWLATDRLGSVNDRPFETQHLENL